MLRHETRSALAALVFIAFSAALAPAAPAAADTFVTSGDKILVYYNFDSAELCYWSHVAGGPGCV